MKLRLISLASLLLLILAFNACTKNQPTTILDQGISEKTLAQIRALGFDSEGAYVSDGGYIVENDIFLSDADLNKPLDLNALIIANNEQYRTTNLVTGLPRNITVRVATQLSTNVLNATIAAIDRYNAENLQITFSRVTSGGDIVVSKAPNGAQYIASSGFPTSSGNPYNSVKFNNTYSNWNANTLASVMAHEIGHCIGFRHTDYMDRSFSCGGGYSNEGQAGVGAINIPGTPTAADAGSWMLACIGNGTNRPFNNNDVVGLNYLY